MKERKKKPAKSDRTTKSKAQKRGELKRKESKGGNDSCSQGGACCFKIPTCCLFWICNALWKQKGTKRSSLSKERRERDRDKSRYRQINETRDREKNTHHTLSSEKPSLKCTSGGWTHVVLNVKIGPTGLSTRVLQLTGNYVCDVFDANREENHMWRSEHWAKKLLLN